MKRTANLDAHRPTPTKNIARHNKAEQRKEAKLQKDSEDMRKLAAAAIENAIAAAADIRNANPAALRRDLQRYKIQHADVHTTKINTYVLTAISEETGEMRHYRTEERHALKFIGNADYLTHHKEPTIYLIYFRGEANPKAWIKVDERKAGKPQSKQQSLF